MHIFHRAISAVSNDSVIYHMPRLNIHFISTALVWRVHCSVCDVCEQSKRRAPSRFNLVKTLVVYPKSPQLFLRSQRRAKRKESEPAREKRDVDSLLALSYRVTF